MTLAMVCSKLSNPHGTRVNGMPLSKGQYLALSRAFPLSFPIQIIYPFNSPSITD
jgi:hypothetical protein